MNILRIADLSGCVSILILCPLCALFIRKRSRLLKKIHSPLTVLVSIILLLHLCTSIFTGSMQNTDFMIVFLSGILAVSGFIASVILILFKRKCPQKMRKYHIVLSLITFCVAIMHIILSEMLL